MTIAGIDFGTTLTKAVWKSDDKYKFVYSKTHNIEDIVAQLKKDGVKEVQVEGIGYTADTHGRQLQNFGFEVHRSKLSPIESEKIQQVEGTKKLLRLDKNPVSEFLLVGMGTGTSYVVVKKSGYDFVPFGNSVGGGFMQGLANLFGVHRNHRFEYLAGAGNPLDKRIKDVLPETDGTFQGELVIANFGKANAVHAFGMYLDRVSNTIDSKLLQDVCATIVHCAAVATIRDVMIIPSVFGKDVEFPKDVVYIGSTVAYNSALKKMLSDYTQLIGKTPHFPTNGAFALALGAYLRIDAELPGEQK